MTFMLTLGIPYQLYSILMGAPTPTMGLLGHLRTGFLFTRTF